MSNLLNDDEGRSLLTIAQWYLLERRMARFFKTRLVTDVDRWSHGSQEFDLGTMLGQLNVANDDGLRDLYRLLGNHGGLYQSLSDQTFYVDSVAGSDVNGTGSAARPYASLWFLKFLPRRINHKYRILIINDLVEDEITITNEFGANGCLSFIGVGAEEILAGANGTVNGVPVLQQNTWKEVTVSGAPGIPSEAHLKYFFQNTNAGSAEYHFCTPINHFDTGNLKYWMRKQPMNALANGDTYNVIRPSRRLTINRVTINASGDKTLSIDPYYTNAHIVFANLNIVVGAPTGWQKESRFVVDSNVDIAIGFCQFELAASVTYPVFFNRAFINRYIPVDDGIAALTGTTVANMFNDTASYPIYLDLHSCGFQFIGGATQPKLYGTSILRLGENVELNSFDAMGQVTGKGLITLYDCSAGTLSFYYSQVNMVGIGIDPEDTSDNGIYLHNSKLTTNKCLFGKCHYAAKLTMSDWHFGVGGGDSTAGTITSFVDYIIELEAQSHLYFSQPWSGQTGPTPQEDLVSFDPVAGPWVAAFPGAGLIQPPIGTFADALGSWASRQV